MQEAFLKFMQANTEKVENQKAYLVRTVINLAINQKNRQQKLIDSYPGEWLPEPVATEAADSILNTKDVLSYSLLVLLEKLNPKERAVFILKEAFDYDHEEIAQVLELSVENSRKLLSRAKSKLKEPSPEKETIISSEYLSKYLEVIRKGDTPQLEKLLHKDIVVISDGGGKASAFINPVAGIPNASKLLFAILHKYYSTFRMERREINHQPALFFYNDNKLVTVQIFVMENDQLVNVYFMRNPDKLKILQESF